MSERSWEFHKALGDASLYLYYLYVLRLRKTEYVQSSTGHIHGKLLHALLLHRPPPPLPRGSLAQPIAHAGNGTQKGLSADPISYEQCNSPP